jgi:hypothetical protein
MATPIYKLFMAKPSVHWYHLSKEEQASLRAKVNEALKEAGGERLLYCNAGWASEEWMGFGVGRFQSIEALQRFQRRLVEIGWPRYTESRMLLGTEAPTA